jgi:hypothetical protein
MKHADFKIGTKFTCGGNKWLCTDVGSRTVVAVCLTCCSENDYARCLPEDAQDQMWKQEDNLSPGGMPEVDPSWFKGPPYALGEHVFDEHDLKACELVPG